MNTEYLLLILFLSILLLFQGSVLSFLPTHELACADPTTVHVSVRSPENRPLKSTCRTHDNSMSLIKHMIGRNWLSCFAYNMPSY